MVGLVVAVPAIRPPPADSYDICDAQRFFTVVACLLRRSAEGVRELFDFEQRDDYYYFLLFVWRAGAAAFLVFEVLELEIAPIVALAGA